MSLISTNIVINPQIHVLLQGIDTKGNLCNITKKTPIDILVKLGTVEHAHVGRKYSIEEAEVIELY